jgi:multiple sugar transport system substrate-binding protein
MPVFKSFFKNFIFLLVLAGCRAQNSDVVDVATFTDPDGIQIMNGLLEKLEKKEGIKARASYIAWNEYERKIITQMAAGKAPDLVWVEVGAFVPLSHEGAFQPLDDLIARDQVDLKAFYPGVMARFSQDGKVYALPQDTAPIACLYYNKKLFRDAGLSYPNASWTWKEFLAAAQKLTHRDSSGKTLVWGFRDNYAPDWANMIYSNGGLMVDDWKNPKHCLLATPEAIEAVQFQADLIRRYKVSPSSADNTSVGGSGADLMGGNGVAMLRSGYWVAGALRKFKDLDWDVAPFPKGPRAKSFAWGTGGTGWAMTRDAKDREKAWKVLKYLASEEVQKVWTAQGATQPALLSLSKSKLFLSDLPPSGKGFLLDAPNHAIYSPNHPRWDEALLNIIGPKIDTVMLGQAQAEPVMKKIAADIDAQILATK